MLARIGIVLLLLVVLLGVILFSYFRYRTGKAKVGALRLRSAPLSLSEFVLGALRERPGDIVAGLGHVIAALVIFYAVFPGLYEWTGKYFIYPFPWGLLFVAGILAWIGAILHKALKGTYSVLKGLGTVILFFAVVCAFVQTGRLLGSWWGWNIFGSDPHTYHSAFLHVEMGPDNTFIAEVPLDKECWQTDVEIPANSEFTLLSVEPVGAKVNMAGGNGYIGFNARGAIADTLGGINISAKDARIYQARLKTKWTNRPAHNPVDPDDFQWNCALPDAPYGALLVELDGKRRFLEVGETIEVKESQTLKFYINFERKSFTYKTWAKHLGKYVVRFVVI